MDNKSNSLEQLIKQIKEATNATMAKKEKLEKIQKEHQNVETLLQNQLSEVETEKKELKRLTDEFFDMKSNLEVKQLVELPAARSVRTEYREIVSGYSEQLEAAQKSVRKMKYQFQEVNVKSCTIASENRISDTKIKEEIASAENELARLASQQIHMEDLKIEIAKLVSSNENTASLNNLLKENVDSIVENLAEAEKEFNFWRQQDAEMQQEISHVDKELKLFGGDADDDSGSNYSNDFVPASSLLMTSTKPAKKFHFRRTK